MNAIAHSNTRSSTQLIIDEMNKSVGLAKCRQCGCLRDTLDQFLDLLPTLDEPEADSLYDLTMQWQAQTQAVQYACLGCAYCYPAAAQNAFGLAFPGLPHTAALACDFRLAAEWPIVVGDYRVLDPAAPIAVSTLASVSLVDPLAEARPSGLALVAKTETENIGIDKIVKNVIANPALQYIILAGIESIGHRSGQTLLALAENGIDDQGRVIGALGKRPFLRNVTKDEVRVFREQVQIIDLIGCTDPATILERITALSPKEPKPCG